MENIMRAWGSVVAALFVFNLSPLGIQIASAADTASGCGMPTDLSDGWTVTTPEAQGMNASQLCAMGEGIRDGKLANVDDIVVVRHGALVYEHYYSHVDASTRHNGYSMTKSIVSLLVGIAMDRGLMGDLEGPVATYFPDNPDLSMPGKDPITLRHLLTMSAALGSDKSPGVAFAYDDRATELLAAILQKVTGKTIDAFARENLFEPLGIKDVEWPRDPLSGLPRAANGLSLRPRDWARIGQLVLDRGVWEERRIVSASWVTQSTMKQIDTNRKGSAGYGFQWWLGRSPYQDRDLPWVAAQGFNSQKIIVIPTLDMVVVFNASRTSAQMVAPELDLLDRYILPATARDDLAVATPRR